MEGHMPDHAQKRPTSAAQRRPLAVVLVSGGLDSCVCLAEARRRFATAVLHVNYGQRTQAREQAAFQAIADHFAIGKRLVVDLGYLRQIGGSSLLDPSRPVEKGLPEAGRVPSTYVPFRNAHILAVGVSWAEVLDAEALFIGAVQEDGSGYPDCTEQFYERFAAVVQTGTRPETQLTIHTPLIHLDKAAIVKRGLALGAPLHLTWSCYIESERACGQCESCRLRLRGFAAAGVPDPVPYLDRSAL
jgi:7-cyano-7-deazaguanine synthase